MWISRNQYHFLKENAEKNIDIECQILTEKENQSRAIARAMEEYSAVLEERDKLIKLCAALHTNYCQTLETLKCNFETADMIFSETIKTENGEESNINKFDSIKAFAAYMKCFNDINMRFIKEKLEEASV